MKEKYRLIEERKNGEIKLNIFESGKYGTKERTAKQLDRIYRERRGV